MLRSVISLCFIIIFLFNYRAIAQNSVGIGTDSPNQNAVLELVSTNGDQGLLVPKLSTAQRTAISFVSALSSNENGLLVFDSDENQFYYWQDSQWQPISNGAGDADADPQNEIQDLQLTGNTLTITNNGSATPIDLSGLAGVDAQTLSVLKTGSDVDVSISNGNTIVVNVDDNDADPANELQDISLVGSDLSITNGSNIDMSSFLDNTDNQPANLVPVTPAGNLVSTDVQSSLEELQSDIDSDLDQNPVNEIQNITISGNAVGIDGGGSGFNLTPLSPSPNQVLKWDGAQWIAGSDDTGVGTLPALADAQILTNNGSNIAVTLSGDLNMNNAGVMTIQPDAVSSAEIADGTIDNLDVSAGANISASKLESTVIVQGENNSLLTNDSGFLTTVSNSDITDVDPSKISQGGAVNGEVLKWNNVGGVWEPATDLVDDADNNSTNEIQDLSLGGNTLSLTNDITPVDLSPYLDNTDNQNAAAVPVTPSGNLASSDVQAALIELQGDIDTDTDSDPTNEFQDLSIATDIISLSNSGSTINLVPYLDNTDNQNAAAVPVTPSGNLTSSDVQAALVELQGDIDTDTDSDPTNEFQDLSIATDIISLSNSASTINLVPYLDNTDNQNAAAVPVAPIGNLTSIEVQAALEELQGDIDLDSDTDNTNEFNLGGSLEANNILRVVDAGGNTDIDISRLTGDLDANTNRINNLVDPALAQDAATKAYVDNGITANTWGITGNSGTTPGTDFVGTTDAQDLVFATNTVSRFRIYDGTGYAALGPLAAGLNPGFGANDRFLTISSDANGPGISGVSSIELSGYSSNLNDEIGRLDFNTRFSGADNLVGRVSVARAGLPNAGELRLGTHNGTTFNNHVIIDENGNVGVGAANPATKLDVVGTLRTTGLILSTLPTNGYVLTSNATGVGTWQPVPSAFSTNNRIPRGNGTTLVDSDIYDDGAGHIGINAPTPTAGLHMISVDGARFSGAVGAGSIPATGAGTRMMWYPGKAAFRVGRTTGTDWDDANIANYSVALGYNGIASGEAAVSIGYDNDVGAFRSVGIGTSNVVNQQQSFAGGVGNQINGQQSFTLGLNNVVGAPYSGAIGWDVETGVQDSALVIGAWAEATGRASYVIGNGEGPTVKLVNNINNSIMMGMGSSNPTLFMNRGQFGQSGDVGIGTTNPQQKLDVAGMIKISTDFTSAVGGSMRFTGSDFEGYDGSSWQSLTMGTWDITGSDAYYNTGFVGIGTTTPLVDLDIRGFQSVGTAIAPTASTITNIINVQAGSNADGATNGITFWENTGGFGMKLGYNGTGAGVNNKLAMYSNTNTELVVFENGGSVGIGVADPSELLEVNGNIVGQSLRDPNNSVTNFVSWDPGGQFRIMNNGNTLMYAATDGSVRVGTQGIVTPARLTVMGFGTGSGESFRTTNTFGTAQFVVLDNGRVGIDVVNPGWSLEVNGSAAKPGGGTWTDASDRRLKQNISSFTDGLEEVLNINPVTYQFKSGYHRDPDQVHIGVIAQEIKEVLPYTVTVKDENIGDVQSPLIYDGSALSYVLINSVKELNNKVESLKDENDELRELLVAQSMQVEALLSALKDNQAKTSATKPNDDE